MGDLVGMKTNESPTATSCRPTGKIGVFQRTPWVLGLDRENSHTSHGGEGKRGWELRAAWGD